MWVRSVANYVAMLLVVAGLLAAIGILPNAWNVGSAPGTAEIKIGLVIVLAIAILLILLYIIVIGFSHYNLTDHNEALGLPPGSVRALISLFLIMLFIIIGIYLVRIVSEGSSRVLTN